MTRDEYVELIKDSAIELGVKSSMAWLTSQFSFIGLSIPNFFVTKIVEVVLTIAIKHAEMGVFFTYIDLRTSKQGKEFEEAALRNKQVKENGTEDEKKKAEQDFIDKFRAFAKFTN
jgi:hypothetical protein